MLCVRCVVSGQRRGQDRREGWCEDARTGLIALVPQSLQLQLGVTGVGRASTGVGETDKRRVMVDWRKSWLGQRGNTNYVVMDIILYLCETRLYTVQFSTWCFRHCFVTISKYNFTL